MKNTITAIVMAASFFLTTMPATAATKVFLLGGQSNMAGAAPVDGLPSIYSEPQNGVNIWSNNQWVTLQGDWQGPNFGPEVTFGYTLHQSFPTDDIYLIKYGVSSTNLAVDWNPNGTGPCYNTFKTSADAAIHLLTAVGKSPVIAGMIWMQGENDALDDAQAAAYSGNLTNFITTARSDFATPNMPFVVGRITTAFGTQTDNDLVRNAEMTVPGQVGNASWINTDDLQLAFTGHYGTQGQIDLGIRFADQFVQTPEPSTWIMTGTALFALAGYLWRRRNLECVCE